MQQAGQRPGSAVLSCLILTPPPIERPGGTMTPLLSPRTKTSKMAQPLPGMKPRPDQALSLNMKLLSHHELQGFGGIGEGMGMQLARDGRRILWLAHESAPKTFTAVDVTDPKNPRVAVQTELPHADVRKPAKPEEVGRWWLPGTRVGDSTPPLARHPKFDSGYRAHNTNVFPQRPDRAYVGYISGGAVILDIADKSRPKLISHWRYSPPYTGFTHTVLPLLDRGLLIVSDEAVKNDGEDWPKLVWVVDAQVETNPVPISTFPMPF